jgi:hypothetical protein
MVLHAQSRVLSWNLWRPCVLTRQGYSSALKSLVHTVYSPSHKEHASRQSTANILVCKKRAKVRVFSRDQKTASLMACFLLQRGARLVVVEIEISGSTSQRLCSEKKTDGPEPFILHANARAVYCGLGGLTLCEPPNGG